MNPNFARSKFAEHPQILGGYLKIILLVATLLLFSCSNDDAPSCTNREVEKENVKTVNAPETGQVNETIKIEVLFDVRKSCGGFNKFMTTGTSMDQEIEVEAIYNDCYCSQVIKTITAIYEFTPEEAGEYTLNFRSGANDFITVNISVIE